MIDLLRKYNSILKKKNLSDLLKEPERFQRFSARLGGLLLDYSRVHLDETGLGYLLELADQKGVTAARDRLFSGEEVNLTEHRPALHMLLRGDCTPADAAPADAQRAKQAGEAMLSLAEALHAGRLPGEPEARITDIVHIGIGGSLLGTQLLHEALGKQEASVPKIHFLGSVDAHARATLLPRLDPASTVVVAASKSFTTGDTLLHARKIRDWLAGTLTDDRVRNRLFAVTGATARAREFGIPDDQVFYLPDWVGGRYSLWSPVSLSAAATMGPEAFRELLRGAADMDRHFREAKPGDNLPILMGLVGFWHRNVCAYGSWAVFSYDHRLRLLHSHLQQVIMESNGKSVTVNGAPSELDTSPVVFGESGTEAQHSVFQALHQGTDIVPVNFVGIVRPNHDDREAHAELLANMLAQVTALACGRSGEDTLKQMRAAGVQDAEELLPHRTFAGNRPSEVIMLDELTPANLGRLLALYEHKVKVERVLWSINAFDQWGVELGKQLAPGVLKGLAGETVNLPGLGGLLDHIRARSRDKA